MSDETTTEQLAEIEEQAADTPATEYTPPEGWRLLAVGELVMLDDQWVRQDGSVWRSMGTEGPVSEGSRYIRRIEPQPEPQPQQNGLVRDVTHLLQESGVLDSAKAEQQIEELRSEVSYVQRLLGEARQRVTQLEELVASLRTINRGCENAVRLAGQENTDLKHRLEVVSAEWAEQSETVRKLRSELDAAQQVPQAVSDRFEEGWNQGTARAVETIAEWLQPIRAVDSEHLANETLQHLPQIMRHLTGLADED